MDSRPAWGVELFNSRYDYFCFEPIVIFVFLDFLFYEYSSFNSSQEFFLHFGIWKNHSKTSHFSLILRTKNLVKFGIQQGGLKKSKTVESRILSQVGSTHLPFPLLGTPFQEYIYDHCTHQPITYLGIFAIKLGLFSINKKIQKLKLEK